MLKALRDRIEELATNLGFGTFPTYGQLKIMLKAEGYSPEEVDRWFASQAVEYLDGTQKKQNLLNKDVYLVLDQESREPLAFWTEGQRRVLPLDAANSESWKAANVLRSTLRTEGVFRDN